MPTNAELVNDFLEHMAHAQRRRPTTLYTYRQHYDSFLRHVGRTPLASVDHQVIQEWLGRGRRGGKPAAPSTIKGELMSLRSLFKFLHEYRGVITANPTAKVDAPKVRNERPHPVPDAVWIPLWASDLEDSDRVAFGLAYFTGLRRAEVTSLVLGNIVDVPRLGLTGVLRKGGGRHDVVVASCVELYAQRRPWLIGGDPATFTDALARLRGVRRGAELLLDWPTYHSARAVHAPIEDRLDPLGFNRRLKRALKAAGLPEGATTPHAMRHSFCTNMLGMGVDLLTVSRLANHTSVSITQRYIYTEADPLLGMLGGDAPSPATPPAEGLTAVARW